MNVGESRRDTKKFLSEIVTTKKGCRSWDLKEEERQKGCTEGWK